MGFHKSKGSLSHRLPEGGLLISRFPATSPETGSLAVQNQPPPTHSFGNFKIICNQVICFSWIRNQLIAYFPWCFANLTNVDSGRFYEVIYAVGNNYLQMHL